MFLLGEEFAETIEASLPKRASLRDPLRSQVQACRLELARPHATDLLRTNDGRVFEHAEMLHHGRQCHIERLGQGTDRARAYSEPLDNRPPRRLREGMEGSVNRRMVKHWL